MSLKNFLIIFFLLFSISNSFGAMVTHNQSVTVEQSRDAQISGIEFNEDGTKMFTSYNRRLSTDHTSAGDDTRFIEEYNLSTPFNISTRVSAGDSERCKLTGVTANADYEIFDITFSSDGMKFLVAQSAESNINSGDILSVFNLTSPYDVSTCVLANKNGGLGFKGIYYGSQAGDYTGSQALQRLKGVEINDDGTKLFLLFSDKDNEKYPDVGARLYEFTLPTPYDVSNLWNNNRTPKSTIVTTAGIELPDTVLGANNPGGMRFTPDGKRILIIGHESTNVLQISLTNAFDTSSYTIDGGLNLNTGISPSNAHPRGVTFSKSGFKLYIGNDNNAGTDQVMEYDLACPFNIIDEVKCPAIAKGDRTGLAIAQIEVATRTIEQSTDTALNRLKWIRRNKDNQNLTNLNLDLNFTNPMLASLAKVVKNSATRKKTKDQNQEQEQEQDIFFWSEGSIAIGRVGDTKVSSFKKIKTDAITVGADKFTKNNGIRGLAFRFGKDDVEVGSAGSNLDTDTYNLTHYTSSPIKDDTKFIDTVIGVGALNFDILSVLDGQRVTAKRDGKQIYGTIKLKDEIKKNNLILIPSGQIDLGYTLLNDYQESGNAAMKFKKQGVQSRNARLSIAAAEELENEKYKIRKHGKLEYKANLNRSSSIKYSYLADTTSGEFYTKLYSGASHNLNGELGVDIILPDSFSIFLIYERNQALEVGHTDKIHLAIGFLPNKKTNYTYKLAGSEHLGSEFKISKKINDFEIDFTLNNQDALRPNTIEEAMLSLRQIF